MVNLKKEENDKNIEEKTKYDDIRRKILSAAKELFLNPIEEGVEPKQKSPSKKELRAYLLQSGILTPEELKLYEKNQEKVFPEHISERQFFDAYQSQKMDKRREVLLRMVAEDNLLKKQRELVQQGNTSSSIKDAISLLPEDEQNILKSATRAIYSTTAAIMELSPEDKAYYFSHGSLPTKEISDSEIEKTYTEFVAQQRAYFEIYINFISKLLCELKKYREVNDSTKLSARIKALDSASKNDSAKALDDIFGMEIDFCTESEKTVIESIIASTLNITKVKNHKKDNGYKAYHCTGSPADIKVNFEDTKLFKHIQERYGNKQFFNNLKNNMSKIWNEYKASIIAELQKDSLPLNEQSNIEELTSQFLPFVEFQSKTIAVALEAINGTAAHFDYKGKDAQVEEETPEEKAKRIEEYKESIQKKFSTLIALSGGKIPFSQVGVMWEDTLDGKGLKSLNNMEILKHIYPFFIDPKDLEEEQPENPGAEAR